MKAKEYFRRIGQSDGSRRYGKSWNRCAAMGWPVWAIEAYRAGYFETIKV